MNFSQWANHKVKKMDWVDISLVKSGVFVFTLLVAKFWEPLLELEWYWYLVMYGIIIARPFYRIYILDSQNPTREMEEGLPC